MRSWLQFGNPNLDLFFIFFAALFASWLGLLGVSHYAAPRSHSTLKFWNDMMARTQLICVAFYITVWRVGDFMPIGKNFVDSVALMVLIGFGLWLMSLNQVRKQEDKIAKHGCVLDNNNVCTKKLSTRDVVSVLYVNILLSIVTAFVTFVIICNPYMTTR